MKRKRIIINRDFFIFIICCILSIILFLSKDIKAVKNIKTHTSNFFSFLFSPKDSAIKFSNIESRNNFLINKLKKINEENFQLREKIATIDKYNNYDEKLDQLIPKYEFIPAKILKHSLSKSAKILNLNIGFKDGVPNDYKAVIDIEGNLVGRTSFISEENREVHKINDKLFHVFVQTTVKDGNTDELIIIKGQFSYISGNRGIIESVSTYYDTKINKGDIFHTTSSSNIYPKGIKVAEVISVKYDNKKNYLDIVVQILTDLDSLEDVFVIK